MKYLLSSAKPLGLYKYLGQNIPPYRPPDRLIRMYSLVILFVSIFYEIPLTLVLRRRNGGYEQYEGIVNNSCCVIIIAVVTDLSGPIQ